MQQLLKSGPWFFSNSCTTESHAVLQQLLHNGDGGPLFSNRCESADLISVCPA